MQNTYTIVAMVLSSETRRGYGSLLRILRPQPKHPYRAHHFYCRSTISVVEALRRDWDTAMTEFLSVATREIDDAQQATQSTEYCAK